MRSDSHNSNIIMSVIPTAEMPTTYASSSMTEMPNGLLCSKGKVKTGGKLVNSHKGLIVMCRYGLVVCKEGNFWRLCDEHESDFKKSLRASKVNERESTLQRLTVYTIGIIAHFMDVETLCNFRQTCQLARSAVGHDIICHVMQTQIDNEIARFMATIPLKYIKDAKRFRFDRKKFDRHTCFNTHYDIESMKSLGGWAPSDDCLVYRNITHDCR